MRDHRLRPLRDVLRERTAGYRPPAPTTNPVEGMIQLREAVRLVGGGDRMLDTLRADCASGKVKAVRHQCHWWVKRDTLDGLVGEFTPRQDRMIMDAGEAGISTLANQLKRTEYAIRVRLRQLEALAAADASSAPLTIQMVARVITVMPKTIAGWTELGLVIAPTKPRTIDRADLVAFLTRRPDLWTPLDVDHRYCAAIGLDLQPACTAAEGLAYKRCVCPHCSFENWFRLRASTGQCENCHTLISGTSKDPAFRAPTPLDGMTPTQRAIIRTLGSDPMTSAQIAEAVNQSVHSINQALRTLRPGIVISDGARVPAYRRVS